MTAFLWVLFLVFLVVGFKSAQMAVLMESVTKNDLTINKGHESLLFWSKLSTFVFFLAAIVLLAYLILV